MDTRLEVFITGSLDYRTLVLPVPRNSNESVHNSYSVYDTRAAFYYFQDLSIVNDLTLLFKLYYRGQTPVYPAAQFLISGK